MMGVVAPAASEAFYTEILSVGKHQWNMEMLFTDFMSDRADGLQGAAKTFEAAHDWVDGMVNASGSLGLEIQMCMASPSQALDSLNHPPITNFRIDSDGGTRPASAVYSSTLASVLGLGWSKDNLRLRTATWEAAAQQTALAVLSLGPVGLADQLEGFPHPPKDGAAVVTNVTLALSTVAADGSLLQPSDPLFPLGELLTHQAPLSPDTGHV